MGENSHESDALLTAEEVAARLRVRKNTIYIWVARREIPFVKLPGDTTRFLTDVNYYFSLATIRIPDCL